MGSRGPEGFPEELAHLGHASEEEMKAGYRREHMSGSRAGTPGCTGGSVVKSLQPHTLMFWIISSPRDLSKNTSLPFVFPLIFLDFQSPP